MSLVGPEQWQALSPYLDQALEMSDADRVTWLEALRKTNPEIASTLLELLEEHSALAREGFLEDKPALPAVPYARETMAGQAVGGYTLVSPLGHGGMGTVWLANRSDGRFERSAAIKFLSVALAGRGEARFKREGRILARLTHPRIAQLVDAGVTPSGQPYLVLEHVDGEHIDRYCDRHGLDTHARLRLFLDVLDAVAYAHANLIVHRDIKPSNVLVRNDGVVKLLDFGIAKLLEDDRHETPATLVTREGGGALTPEFAAPEQVTGGVVSAATDIYALGVLLYLLLTGQHPAGSGSRSPADLIKAIVDVEPPHPSDVAGEKLRRVLRGDLDTIVGTALKKKPAERYASVVAFADDLRRYLNHEPVSVKPDTWRYRAGKFVRRHRVGVAVSAATAAVLLTATTVSAYLAIEARRQRDAAQFQARRAEASSEFMRYLVTQIGDTPMTMKQVLDRGRAALEQQYGGDPAFVGRMLFALSGPYIELGDHATGSAMASRALEIAVKIDDADLIAATQCGSGYDAVQRRDLAAARTHLAEGRRQIARVRSPSAGLLVECAVGETHLAIGEARFDDAIAHATEAVELLKAAGNTSTTRYTSALNNLGTAYAGAGRWREAALTQRQVTEVSKQIGRGRTIGVVTSLHNEGSFERLLGWWLAAERVDLEAIDILRGLEPSGRLPAYLALNYGRLRMALGHPAEGVELVRQVFDEPNLSPRFVPPARIALASGLLDMGDAAGARAELAQVDLGKTPPAVDRTAAALVRVRLTAADGRLAEARRELAEALRVEGYPAAPSTPAHLLLEYGSRLAIEGGDFEEAVRLARAAIAACERLGTEPSAYTGRAHLTLGLALLANGRPADARTEIARGETLVAQAAGVDHPWAREARAKLAEVPAGR